MDCQLFGYPTFNGMTMILAWLSPTNKLRQPERNTHDRCKSEEQKSVAHPKNLIRTHDRDQYNLTIYF